ncbi:chaplin [Streptomyces sp. JJ36]|uniref:chaplin n=1 Tax=Streptomyces sp. JJ36 TaxID=2736645 RepID=UPI001F30667B|nr:chaplin [Streptomyces sp. JJ36]MCF6525736.1 chaplin [Streptomyces sp. JJ36]
MKTVKKAALVVAATGAAVGASAGTAFAGGGDGANAQALAAGSPGLISGNVVQIPVDIPIQICGNTVDIVGVLNPTFGNTCVVK